MFQFLAEKPTRRILGLACIVAALAVSAASAAAPKAGDNFKDWTVGCEKPKEADREQCYIFQNLVMKTGGQRVLHVAVGYLAKEKKPAAILTFPLGISLPPGVAVQVDEQPVVRFQIERCHQNGCIGALALDDKLITAFKKGNQARVIFYDNTRREIGVPVSLKGFTAGFNALER